MSLLPFPLYPAFRSGKLTPWGGVALHEIYGKDTPDAHTGESLEMSVITGLDSTDSRGEPLRSLIAREGARLTGTRIGDPFPLLLKLIDARDRLSVQVHPDDAYALTHENKLGKTEAWVILRAEPGARLVYGIREGVTKEMLKSASEQGKEIEKLLRFVPAHQGDVFFIPSGMVHAICGGILLYEIQESSDITYRFYDWDRTDAQGNRRPLHIRQAVDVARLDLQPDAVIPTPLDDATCKRELLLNTRFFRLERLTDCVDTPFTAEITRFSVLTLLTGGSLQCEGETPLALHAGQTVFISADCVPFTLSCGQCLIASPSYN